MMHRRGIIAGSAPIVITPLAGRVLYSTIVVTPIAFRATRIMLRLVTTVGSVLRAIPPALGKGLCLTTAVIPIAWRVT